MQVNVLEVLNESLNNQFFKEITSTRQFLTRKWLNIARIMRTFKSSLG